jgi:hypothetical protein
MVRIGDTLRRPGLLDAAGFDGAPRPLGLDKPGHEILTFIPGTIPDQIAFTCAAGACLRPVVRLIRDFHDAVTGFCQPPDARWQPSSPPRGPASASTTTSPLEPGHQPGPGLLGAAVAQELLVFGASRLPVLGGLHGAVGEAQPAAAWVVQNKRSTRGAFGSSGVRRMLS